MFFITFLLPIISSFVIRHNSELAYGSEQFILQSSRNEIHFDKIANLEQFLGTLSSDMHRLVQRAPEPVKLNRRKRYGNNGRRFRFLYQW